MSQEIQDSGIDPIDFEKWKASFKNDGFYSQDEMQNTLEFVAMSQRLRGTYPDLKNKTALQVKFSVETTTPLLKED